ncbi:MAG: hydrogenase nickel incorporation protein HypB [Armatimonadetes bacterium]|nr:hydrogenase nickel incorporation protein HypB [Armatimonadota bacterium]
MKIEIEENILEANDTLARQVRSTLDARQILGVNLLGSPGAGKTTLIESTADALQDRYALGVIEGDIASSIDMERLQKRGLPVVQVNTGGLCHLDANMILQALRPFDPDRLDALVIENIGNLVCPADFDIGHHVTVLVSSVPEGDDKPHKYPIIFRSADAVVLAKGDLLPYIDFDLARYRDALAALNPDVPLFPLSCRTGEGMSEWLAWFEEQIAADRG